MNKTTTNREQVLKEYLLPMLIEAIIFGLLMMLFNLFVKRGPLLQDVRLVGDETSSPTLGRLIYGILSFIGFIVFSALASKEDEDKESTKPFWFGFVAGILLWQSLGEILWHFYVGGINFAPLENITSFPFVIIILMIFIYGKKHHSFSFGIWCVFVTFMCNWLGHYISIGIYPFVESLISSRTWNVSMSIICGGLFFITSIRYLLYRTKTKRGRHLASLFSFIALAIIFFGLIEG